MVPLGVIAPRPPHFLARPKGGVCLPSLPHTYPIGSSAKALHGSNFQAPRCLPRSASALLGMESPSLGLPPACHFLLDGPLGHFLPQMDPPCPTVRLITRQSPADQGEWRQDKKACRLSALHLRLGRLGRWVNQELQDTDRTGQFCHTSATWYLGLVPPPAPSLRHHW